MNRIRFGALLTVILGVIYASAGLFDSLRDFGIGMAVAATGLIIYGLTDFIDAHHSARMAQYRAEVWHRRDQDAIRYNDEAA